MNTRKQVLVMVVLLMVGLMGIAAYSAWDPDRNESAQAHFNERVAERGSILFARNCRLCHGDMGEGGVLGGRLPAAPALDRAQLQGFIEIDVTLSADVTATADTIEVSNAQRLLSGSTVLIEDERMRVRSSDGNTVRVERAFERTEASFHAEGTDVMLLDPAVLQDQIDLVTNTIVCGRVGTAMPSWAQSQGGPLSDEQIRQLVVLITEDWWELVAHEVEIEDAIDSELTRDIDENTISLPVSDVSQFNEDEAIRIGDERLRVTGVPNVAQDDPDKSGIVSVERGILGTVPLPHAVDEEIFRFPEPADPAILQQSCGQTARPQAPAAPPSEKDCAEPCQTVDIVARGVMFDLDEIRVDAGGNVRIHFDNQDQGVEHNVAVYQSSSNLTPVASGSVGTIFEGPGIDDVVFETPSTGTYFFRCDVHPTTMTGDFIVE